MRGVQVWNIVDWVPGAVFVDCGWHGGRVVGAAVVPGVTGLHGAGVGWVVGGAVRYWPRGCGGTWYPGYGAGSGPGSGPGVGTGGHGRLVGAAVGAVVGYVHQDGTVVSSSPGPLVSGSCGPGVSRGPGGNGNGTTYPPLYGGIGPGAGGPTGFGPRTYVPDGPGPGRPGPGCTGPGPGLPGPGSPGPGSPGPDPGSR